MDRLDDPIKIPPRTNNNYKQKDVFVIDKTENKKTKKKPKVKKMTSGNRKKKYGGKK